VNSHAAGPERAQRLIDSSIVFHNALRQNEVRLFHLMVFKLQRQKTMRFGGAGKKKDTAGAAVEPMDHIEFFASHFFQFLQKGFSGQIAPARNDDLPGSLRYGKKMRVFMEKADGHGRKNL